MIGGVLMYLKRVNPLSVRIILDIDTEPLPFGFDIIDKQGLLNYRETVAALVFDFFRAKVVESYVDSEIVNDLDLVKMLMSVLHVSAEVDGERGEIVIPLEGELPSAVLFKDPEQLTEHERLVLTLLNKREDH
jgi:hypothetical protein